LKTRIQKWGNSLALRIPKSYAADVQLTQETLVDISVEGDALIVRPLLPSSPTLTKLLAGVTESNLHGETDYGPCVGREEW
jgi:antitoxin MazE